jgi:hypothetical protein
MPRFILIDETTRHASYLTEDEIRRLIDVRHNPGGYTDVDRCMAMIQTPDDRTYRGFPLMGLMGQALMIHVEGRMDFPAEKHLMWKEPGHRCDPRCLLGPRRPGSRRPA